VKPASLSLIAEPLCSSCHSFAAPEKFLRALLTPERELASVLQLVKRTRDGDLTERVQAARSRLRGHSHELDLYAVTREAAQALAERDAIAAAAQAKKSRPRWSSVALGALLVAGAVVIALGGAWIGWFVVRPLRSRVERRFPAVRLGGGLAIGGLTLAAVALIFTAWRSYDYVENDPRFCTSCHLMEEAYTAWQQSAHKDVTCHACHKNDVAANLHQVWLFVTEDPQEVVKHAVVDRAACETCHSAESSPAKWHAIAATTGHKVHAGKQRIECVQCHAPQVHRFRATEEVCAGCHKQVTLASAGGMSEQHCTSCHRFLAEGAKSLKPDRAACLECHAQTDGKPLPAGHARLAVYHVGGKDAPMQWACSECHKPHRQIKMKSSECAECHEEEIQSRVHKVEDHGDCTDCHKPHGWVPATGCLDCHDEMPRP
jgi:hypothetical protein